MNREEFDALVKRIEERAARDPQKHKVRTGILALAGYSFLGAMLLGCLALIVLLGALVITVPSGATIKLALVLGIAAAGLGLAILRALWVRMQPPVGVEIRREDAPALFTELDSLRAALRCLRFHHVLLEGDYNAAVVQVPRLGVFGWHRNYLLLGLPLMEGLGREEFRAVLAHEFAHLSGEHNRFSNWIYRMRRTWDRLVAIMVGRRSAGGRIVGAFLNWFWPRFNAHAFVLSRANEYEADALSARVAGADHAAAALMRVKVHNRLLAEGFWPSIYDQAKTLSTPPATAFAQIGTALRQGMTADQTARWLQHAFREETNNADTHPCLRDRLRALGKLPAGIEEGPCPVELPPLPPRSAAEVFLGNSLERLRAMLDAEWAKAVQSAWYRRHQEAKQVAEKLARLTRETESPSTAPVAERIGRLWERAQLIHDLEGDAGARAVVEQILSLDAGHPGANFVLGRLLLEADDAAGVAHVECAMEGAPALVQPGLNLLYGFYTRAGQKDKLQPLLQRFDRHAEQMQLAQAERAAVTAQDRFVPHGLTEPEVAALRQILAQERAVAVAAVAQKRLRYFPEQKLFVVAVWVKVPWHSFRTEKDNHHLINHLVEALKLPGQFLVFVAERNLKKVGRSIREVPQAVVYQRGSA
jgi:Zn-dependent protease with chaperone function